MDILWMAIYCAPLLVDSKQRSWLGPTQFIEGSPPFDRDSFGFASVSGNIYVYGGIGDVIGN